MEIIDNEFDIPEPNPRDNLYVWTGTIDAQDYLDRNFRAETRPTICKVGRAALEMIKDWRTYALLTSIGGYDLRRLHDSEDQRP